MKYDYNKAQPNIALRFADYLCNMLLFDISLHLFRFTTLSSVRRAWVFDHA